MARARLTNTTNDLQADDGAVLWSFIQGERLEFPITCDFLTNAGDGYTYEAVVIEGDNAESLGEKPTSMATGAIETTLTVRVPVERGAWKGSGTYQREEVVHYDNIYYKLGNYIDYVSATPPDFDAAWVEYNPNQIYIQFDEALSLDWATQPGINLPIYGFFELSVEEPPGGVFQRRWKPMRGMVEILFSPTQKVV